MFLLIIYLIKIIKLQDKQVLYRCNVDDDHITPIPAKNFIFIPKDKRRLHDGDFGDFHIYLDIINIKNDIIKYHLEQYEDLFINSLNKVVKTLETILKVKKLNKGYTFSDESIYDIQIENWNKSMIGNNSIGDMHSLGIDLFIFGRFDDNMDNSTLANAGVRYLDNETGQPLIGIVNINTNVNYSKMHSQEYFQSIIILYKFIKSFRSS